MQTTGSVEVEWVFGKFIGDSAKSVLAHAAAGLSYKILDQGKQGAQPWVIAAFRRATLLPLPDHLVRITDPQKVAKLEKQ
ncbi:MAG TPA: hypothetical protein VLA77_05065 [Candidatus Saccharimonadales bacterium]|nr:hypothetical protein [Candidatus Saccharimonadales bacterium]